ADDTHSALRIARSVGENCSAAGASIDAIVLRGPAIARGGKEQTGGGACPLRRISIAAPSVGHHMCGADSAGGKGSDDIHPRIEANPEIASEGARLAKFIDGLSADALEGACGARWIEALSHKDWHND